MTARTVMWILAALCVPSACSSAVAKDVPMRPFLSVEAVDIGVRACFEYAEKKGLRIALAVADSGGDLVYFRRMDDVYLRQGDLAQLKAESAATTPLSTKELGDRLAQDRSPLRGIEHLPGLTTVEGGEPIRVDAKRSVGGVGVSGAAPHEDGECARAAALAIATALRGGESP